MLFEAPKGMSGEGWGLPANFLEKCHRIRRGGYPPNGQMTLNAYGDGDGNDDDYDEKAN